MLHKNIFKLLLLTVSRLDWLCDLRVARIMSTTTISTLQPSASWVPKRSSALCASHHPAKKELLRALNDLTSVLKTHKNELLIDHDHSAATLLFFKHQTPPERLYWNVSKPRRSAGTRKTALKTRHGQAQQLAFDGAIKISHTSCLSTGTPESLCAFFSSPTPRTPPLKVLTAKAPIQEIRNTNCVVRQQQWRVGYSRVGHDIGRYVSYAAGNRHWRRIVWGI